MKLAQLVGQRIKEIPKDAQSISHIFLIRGGYIRPVSSGIYTLLPLAKRITTKIEKIIREEMDKIDGQEILMPLVNPAELWEESGRYQAVDQSLLRFEDRNKKPMILAMTCEETVCHLAKTEITSYKQLPAMLYQIQTKYRDEARPRAGLIRVREFTMKDAYSFHTSQKCLQKYYQKVHQAYENIFDRVGIKNFICVESDGGMIGNSLAHEFMALSDIGEDTLFISEDEQYKANKEIAYSKLNYKREKAKDLKLVHTPKQKTIEQVSSFLKIHPANTAKTVLYYSKKEKQLFLVMIRGDREVNQTKLKNHFQVTDLAPANDEHFTQIGSQAGYASAYQLDRTQFKLIIDPSVAQSSNLVIGANKEHYHYLNFNFKRDLNHGDIIDIATVCEGDPCPITRTPLKKVRGIEIGNIFQLGDKYSKAMNLTYLDQNGKAKIPIMGCYGIGVGRTLASVIEQSNDKYGPIWSLAIAPWHLHIIALNTKGNDQIKADQLYDKFNQSDIEVIYDDRGVKAGFAFNDADLLGIPYRLILSSKTLEENKVELKMRDGSQKYLLDYDEAFEHISKLIKKQLDK